MALIFFWAERTGRLERLARRPRRPHRATVEPPRALRSGTPRELVDRLKVFQEFLENLPPGEDDSESKK
jgi:hypothetical protein